MNLKEALIALANGKKIRQTNWNPGVFVRLTTDGKRFSCEDGNYCGLTPNSSFEWEEYKEPLSFAEICSYGFYDTVRHLIIKSFNEILFE